MSPLQPGVEILIAQLSEIGFESFVEVESGLTAYIQKKSWRPDILETIPILSSKEFTISYVTEEIPYTNWNATWEENFEPIQIDDRCLIRAPFHESAEVDYEIVIEPKMSFGTGHHETTHMMLEFILENEFNNKHVLDMGCGTGVLAILAEKRGAAAVDAIDIDTWCYENAIENVDRNACSGVIVMKGDASLLEEDKYDVILANINRNILLTDLPTYRRSLKKQGILFLSGFYSEDEQIVVEACSGLGFRHTDRKERNDWISLKFVI